MKDQKFLSIFIFTTLFILPQIIFSFSVKEIKDYEEIPFKFESESNKKYEIFYYSNELEGEEHDIIFSLYPGPLVSGLYKIYVYYSQDLNGTYPQMENDEFINADLILNISNYPQWEYRLSQENETFNKKGYFFFCIYQMSNSNYVSKFSVFNTYYVPELKKNQLNHFKITGSYEHELKFKVPTEIAKDYYIHFSFAPYTPIEKDVKWFLGISGDEKSNLYFTDSIFGSVIYLNQEKEVIFSFDTLDLDENDEKMIYSYHQMQILFDIREKDYKEEILDDKIIKYSSVSNIGHTIYYNLSNAKDDDYIFFQVTLSQDYKMEDFCNENKYIKFLQSTKGPDQLDESDTPINTTILCQPVPHIKNGYYFTIQKQKDMKYLYLLIDIIEGGDNFPSYTISLINLEILKSEKRETLKPGQNKIYYINYNETILDYPDKNILIYANKPESISTVAGKFDIFQGNSILDQGRKMIFKEIKQEKNEYSDYNGITILALNAEEEFNIDIKFINKSINFIDHNFINEYKPMVYENFIDTKMAYIINFYQENKKGTEYIKFYKKIFGEGEIKYINLDKINKDNLDEIFTDIENFELTSDIKTINGEIPFKDGIQNELILVKTSKDEIAFNKYMIDFYDYNNDTLKKGDFKFICLNPEVNIEINLEKNNNIELNIIGENIDIDVIIDDEEVKNLKNGNFIRKEVKSNLRINNKGENLAIIEIKVALDSKDINFINESNKEIVLEKGKLHVLETKRKNLTDNFITKISQYVLAEENSQLGVYIMCGNKTFLSNPPNESFGISSINNIKRANFYVENAYAYKNSLEFDDDIYILIYGNDITIYAGYYYSYEYTLSQNMNLEFPKILNKNEEIHVVFPKYSLENDYDSIIFGVLPFKNTTDINFKLINGKVEGDGWICHGGLSFFNTTLENPKDKNYLIITGINGGGFFEFYSYNQEKDKGKYEANFYSSNPNLLVTTSYADKKYFFELEFENFKKGTDCKYEIYLISKDKGKELEFYEELIKMNKTIFDFTSEVTKNSKEISLKLKFEFEPKKDSEYFVTSIGTSLDETNFRQKYKQKQFSFSQKENNENEGSSAGTIIIIILVVILIIFLIIIALIFIRKAKANRSLTKQLIEIDNIQ